MSVKKRIAGGVVLFHVTLTQASELPALKDEIQWLQAEQFVTTATKTRERVDRSGSTVTVITHEQLRQMGARSVMDALKRVPGLGVNQINVGVTALEVRGVKTDFTEKVLFLINGHPINNNLVNGGAMLSRHDLPVADIQAIEVVRGPGSALYGANAFVAVINIVTRSGEELAGSQINVAGGSFNSAALNLAHGEANQNLEYAVNLNLYHTDGWGEEVARDSLGGSGPTDYWQQRYELGVQGRMGGFEFQGRYLEREAGDYLGAFSVVNDGSEQNYQEYFLEAAYNYSLSSGSHLISKVYHDHFEFDNTWEYLDDFYLRSPIKHDRTGAEVQWNWASTGAHKLLVGGALEHQTQYGVELWTNNGSGPLIDVSDSMNWNGDHRRDIVAAFVQDIWDPTDAVRVIAGARYDRYSDFGGTFNPRFSVSWQATERYQWVATYGSAFRAPTFGELYNTNNNSVVGNPDLEPEEIDTVELSLRTKLGHRSYFHVTGFYNKIEDAIIPTAGSGAVNYSENAGELKVLGVEMEYEARFLSGSSFNVNYTYQDPQNEALGVRVAEVPLHRANLLLNHRFSRSWKGFLGVLYESSLDREPDDIRSPVPDQASVDLALSWLNVSQDLVVTASVYNLLDEQLVFPARDVNNNGMSDFPAAGRSFMVEVEYALR
ncbi:MAG: TonB-dependent receptor [Pseudomonadota bacterium]|nr:TonB-dependent receptor [Pseudomonadota bacterium]